MLNDVLLALLKKFRAPRVMLKSIRNIYGKRNSMRPTDSYILEISELPDVIVLDHHGRDISDVGVPGTLQTKTSIYCCRCDHVTRSTLRWSSQSGDRPA
eukprot:8844963-Pyramimonas_sp.AAC.1